MPQPTTDTLNDITVMRELQKMKKWIIDNCYGKIINNIEFNYGEGEESNKVYFTITFNDNTTMSASFDAITITSITTRVEGDIVYLVITLSNGVDFDVPLDVSNFVTIDGNQTISGDKLFTGNVQVRDITHDEGEPVQETNDAVNERFFKIHASERIDSIEDEIGDVGQEGTIRGDINTNKNSIVGILQDLQGVHNDLSTITEDVTDLYNNKQNKLVSGVNISTVNHHDMTQGGDISTQWGEIEGNIESQGDLIEKFNTKQDELVSGQNIKTVNGVSVLGSGDIPIASGGSHWKHPETFEQLVGSTFCKVALKINISLTASSWSSEITDAHIYSSDDHIKIMDMLEDQTNHKIIDCNSNGITLLDAYKHVSTIRLRAEAFNGGGYFYNGVGVNVNSSNYSDYIDLTKSMIWVE